MEEFLKTITDQIRCVKARDGVAREIKDHILDQAAAYEKSGDDHSAALEKAVRDMGDPVEIGVALDAVHRPQFDWKMLALTLLLNIAGLIVMYGAFGSERFSRQCAYTVLGFAITIGMCFIDYTFIGRCSHIIYIAMTAVMFLCAFTGRRINGILRNCKKPADFVLYGVYNVEIFRQAAYRNKYFCDMYDFVCHSHP